MKEPAVCPKCLRPMDILEPLKNPATKEVAYSYARAQASLRGRCVAFPVGWASGAGLSDAGACINTDPTQMGMSSPADPNPDNPDDDDAS